MTWYFADAGTHAHKPEPLATGGAVVMGVAGSQAQNPGGGCFVVVAALDATGAGAGSAVDAAAESGGWLSFVGSPDTSHKKSSTDLNITYK